MRRITGWRFLIFIAMPLVLATLSAVNLSYDLLSRVENGSNQAEHERNFAVLSEAMANLSADLGFAVADNSDWEEAVTKTTGQVDADWFNRRLASSPAMGGAYDKIAVFDLNTGAVLMGSDRGKPFSSATDIVGERGLEPFRAQLQSRPGRLNVVSGFLFTPSGPVVVAMAQIMSSAKEPDGNGRVLVASRQITPATLERFRRSLLIGGLAIAKVGAADIPHVDVKTPDGRVAFAVEWHNRQLGNLVTASAWTKATAFLGFLVLVMTGIGCVCWTLVQQLVQDEHTAQHNAQHDHLTGLPNRLALSNAMQALQDRKQPYALAFADLDGFKEVNDSYGHEFGDKLIFMVANGVRQLAGKATLCARLGGDEFVTLFEGDEAEANAKVFAEHFIAMLHHPFDMDGRLAAVGASVGIALQHSNFDVTEMLRRADIAMYKAKENGRNRFCVFDESFDAERSKNVSIAAELKSILVSGNLDVAFQPVVHAGSHAITGVEALARWPSKSAQSVNPDKFVAIAENCGLIDMLGALVLEKACVAAADWPNIRLAVNISAVQLNNPTFVDTALGILRKHGIEANRVEFEITESSLIHDTDRAKQVFKALQQAGIKVALDDFGTGFSSIGYLRTYQFDRIKIDKSIVSKVLSSASELAVVQGTLLVARGLSAEVTAEGVETSEQASVLRLAGCTELQGFYFHKPMPAPDISNLLRKHGAAIVPRSILVA